MENELKHFVVPCTKCIKNCSRVHGRVETMPHSSCFFKVMLGDFGQRLRVPPAFVAQIKNGSGIDQHVVLQGPTHHHWIVKVCITNKGMEFVQGWEKFVSDHRIELGDFLVFKYIYRSYIKVRVFGRSACEKRCPDKLIKSTLPPVLISEHEETHRGNCFVAVGKKEPKSASGARPSNYLGDCRTPAQKEKVKSQGTEKTYQGIYFVSCRRPVTQKERDKVLKDANDFKSDRPFGIIVMKPSHVYQGFWLNFPKKYGDLLQLPSERTDLTLVDPNKKEWPVIYLGNRDAPGLSGGWRSFSLANNLEEGDICIFEQVPNYKRKLKVHIFRVVKNCTPYKRMEGSKRIDDNIGSPTNHSNKKMKADRDSGKKQKIDRVSKKIVAIDLYSNKKQKVDILSKKNVTINLSEKAFGPEQGKDSKQKLKQVQGKKETATVGSESNCIELNKGTPFSGGKPSCRRSPRFTNKELCPEAFEDEQKTIVRDIVVNTSVDGVNDEEEDLVIISDSSDASCAIVPFEQSIHEGPYITEFIISISDPKPEPISMVAPLSPEEAATSEVHMNGSGISNKMDTLYTPNPLTGAC